MSRRGCGFAHELYHALEVARATWTVDRSSFATLYRRIGYQSSGHPLIPGASWINMPAVRGNSVFRIAA